MIALLYSKFGDGSGKNPPPSSGGGTGETTAGNHGTAPRSILHQGLDGQLILPPANINRPGPIVCWNAWAGSCAFITQMPLEMWQSGQESMSQPSHDEESSVGFSGNDGDQVIGRSSTRCRELMAAWTGRNASIL